MFWYINVAVFFLAVQGRQIPPRNCRVVDDQVDRILAASNDDFKRKGIPEYTEGINQYISLSVAGCSIPVQIFFNTSSRGELRSVATLYRSSNATVCSDGYSTTLEGVFQFDVLDLHFNEAKTKFLTTETGTFSYKIRPSVNIFIVKNRNDCHLDSYSIATTDSVDYKFEPDSWTGRVKAMLLQETLRRADTTPLLMYVQEATQDFVKTYFTKAWCESMKLGKQVYYY